MKQTLTASTLLAEGKAVKKGFDKDTTMYWSLEACVKAVCDQTDHFIVSKEVKAEAVKAAKAIDKKSK